MVKEEFGKKLTECRESRGITKTDVARQMNLMYKQVDTLEKVYTSYAMSRVYEYMKAIKYQMVLQSDKYDAIFKLNSGNDFIEAFKTMRVINRVTQKEAATITGITHGTIRTIENQNYDIKVDNFLKLIYGLNYYIKFIPLE